MTDPSALPAHEQTALIDLTAALNASGALPDGRSLPFASPGEFRLGDDDPRARLAYHVAGGTIRSISARYCELTAIPPSLGCLASLQLLDLTGNHLAALPDTLAALTDLRRLYLDENRLAALSDWIGTLSALDE